MKYNLTEQELSDIVYTIAKVLPIIRSKSELEIEDIIYKKAKDKINQHE